MIVDDSSAFVAILLGEPEADTFSDLIGEDGAPHASSVILFETRIVLSFRGGTARLREFDDWLRVAGVVANVFDESQSALALDAYRRPLFNHYLTGSDALIKNKWVRAGLKRIGFRAGWYDTHGKLPAKWH